MSASAFFGFFVDSEFKVAYNHADGYPEVLGENVVQSLVNRARGPNWLAVLKARVQLLRAVGSTPPTTDDIIRCAPYTDIKVASKSTEDWYCLLRLAQGSICGLDGILATGMYLEVEPSEFMDYGYIVDLDTYTFDFYRGLEIVKSFDLLHLQDWERTWTDHLST